MQVNFLMVLTYKFYHSLLLFLRYIIPTCKNLYIFLFIVHIWERYFNLSSALNISKLLLSICSLLFLEIAELLRTNKEVHNANAREYTMKYAR